MRLVIDTDTASDDAVALMLALVEPGVEVEAITVVAGNVPLPQAVRNAIVTCDVMGRPDVPVHAGRPGPVMRPLGLPGSATVPLVVGYIMNIYAAAGAMTALHLTGQQITVLALAILIGHNLIVEGAVLRKAGMSGTAFGVLRVVAGLAAAGLANLLMKAF